ncbi:hypothetical protein OAE03_02580 [Winogradskyella sp.]|nr:hypothetical protein [Winogradskyella sp.]MDC0006465.1 hypothetical protein [Winogradskyella sp.]MDC0009422.1 hypothetical protein [Winogradskyella sp.]MDC1503849.1 hypothetical protein [Winogradskyella sp.]
MKTLNKLYLIFVIIFMFLSSCVTEADMWERTYQINNNSGRDIIIRLYKNFSNEIFEDIEISNNQSYRGDKIEGSNYDALNDAESIKPGQSYSSFKVIVVFENIKSIEYSRIDSDGDDIPDSFSEPINRNLLRAGNYITAGNEIYEFVLTEEDYNNAIPCDGDCLD